MNTPENYGSCEMAVGMAFNFQKYPRRILQPKQSFRRRPFIGEELMAKWQVIGVGKIGSIVAKNSWSWYEVADMIHMQLTISSNNWELAIVNFRTFKDFRLNNPTYTEEPTKHGFNWRKELKMCKRVRIVNVARGGMIDEKHFMMLWLGHVQQLHWTFRKLNPTTKPKRDYRIHSLIWITLFPHHGASAKEALQCEYRCLKLVEAF